MRALVLSGGGMRGAYGSGAVDAIARMGFDFDAVYGTSVGGAMAAWFAAAQTDVGTRTWDAVEDPAVMSYRRWLTGRGPLIDLRHLYATLYADRFRLDIDRIRRRGFPVWVTATEAETGKRQLFDLRRVDVAHALMATSGIPFATEAPFELDGRLWFDGGLADPLPVQAALDDGATEMLVVDNSTLDRRNDEPRAFTWFLGRRWPALAELARRHNELYRAAERLVANLPRGVKAVTIRPDADHGVHRFTRDLDRIRELLAIGRHDALRALRRSPAFSS